MTCDDAKFNVFVLCGILFSEQAYNHFDARFRALKEKYFGTQDIVFHFSKMRACKEPFKIFTDVHVKDEFRTDLEQILVEEDYTIIASVVDRPKFKEKFPDSKTAYQESLQFLCDSCDIRLRNEDIEKLFIYLEKRDSYDSIIRKYYSRLLLNGTGFMSKNETPVFSEKLEFKNKKLNISGLQLADICAYPIARKYLTPDVDQRTYEIIKHKFYKNSSGEILSYGLEIFPF